jgi:hypothetical protein
MHRFALFEDLDDLHDAGVALRAHPLQPRLLQQIGQLEAALVCGHHLGRQHRPRPLVRARKHPPEAPLPQPAAAACSAASNNALSGQPAHIIGSQWAQTPRHGDPIRHTCGTGGRPKRRQSRGNAAAARAQLPQRVVLLEAVGVDLAPSVHERVELALELGIVQLPLQHGGPIAGLVGRWLPSSLS